MIGDVELVHAAQTGDAAALGMLLESHRARLYATALAILRDRARAQDAVQDAFLTALQHLHELRNPAAAGAWLHSIVRNACLMRLRACRELPGEIPARAGEYHRDVDAALEQLVLRDWLWTALEALPDDLRATVMLRYFTRHTAYSEIATILDIPVGTVRSRLNQAKRRLADAVVAAATASHHDHAALVQERWCWWRTLTEQIEHAGTAALYVADAAPDALVEAPSLGYRMRGAEDHARGMVETVAAGVRMRPIDIVTSAGVTIVEGDYENPPDDPHHCPPTHTEIRFHPEGPTTHIILYYGTPEAEKATASLPSSVSSPATPLQSEERARVGGVLSHLDSHPGAAKLGPPNSRRLTEPIAVSQEDLVPQATPAVTLEAKLDLSVVRESPRDR